VNFGPPGICLRDGASIYLFPRISSTGIFGPVDRFIGPPDRFKGDQIPRDTSISSFHSENSLHLLPSLGRQPFPALCLFMSVCVCLSLPVCLYLSASLHALCLSASLQISLLSAHVSHFDISYLAPCLFLPASWSSRFLPFGWCRMPSLYLLGVCN